MIIQWMQVKQSLIELKMTKRSLLK